MRDECLNVESFLRARRRVRLTRMLAAELQQRASTLKQPAGAVRGATGRDRGAPGTGSGPGEKAPQRAKYWRYLN
jgi:hypothetical protein